MTTAQQYDDPFAGAEKAPSLSFKDAPIGTVYTGVVTEGPKLVQSRDYQTGEPAFWPVKNPGDTPNPKMSVVINLDVDGEPRSLWAGKPSQLFGALADAQKRVGQRIEAGGTLSVKFQSEKPSDNPRFNPQKIYAVKYEPPVKTATPAADPFDGAAASDDPPF